MEPFGLQLFLPAAFEVWPPAQATLAFTDSARLSMLANQLRWKKGGLTGFPHWMAACSCEPKCSNNKTITAATSALQPNNFKLTDLIAPPHFSLSKNPGVDRLPVLCLQAASTAMRPKVLGTRKCYAPEGAMHPKVLCARRRHAPGADAPAGAMHP